MIGIPYARAGVDEHGAYAECPVCGAICHGDAPTFRTDEDRATKGASRAYADHYAAHHEQGERDAN